MSMNSFGFHSYWTGLWLNIRSGKFSKRDRRHATEELLKKSSGAMTVDRFIFPATKIV